MQEIEVAIGKLSDTEVLVLVDRLREWHVAAWDRQIESDSAAGRLGFLVQEAQGEAQMGNAKPLDEILGND